MTKKATTCYAPGCRQQASLSYLGLELCPSHHEELLEARERGYRLAAAIVWEILGGEPLPPPAGKAKASAPAATPRKVSPCPECGKLLSTRPQARGAHARRVHKTTADKLEWSTPPG